MSRYHFSCTVFPKQSSPRKSERILAPRPRVSASTGELTVSPQSIAGKCADADEARLWAPIARLRAPLRPLPFLARAARRRARFCVHPATGPPPNMEAQNALRHFCAACRPRKPSLRR